MKNNHFKNALISGACAIISGVLLLGANAVFGEAPTHEPPGTGIAPTFTGLTVKGTTDFQGNIANTAGDVNVNDNLTITENVQLGSDKQIYFSDNGQIKSKDELHKILFRRSENKMELREYGDIVFSPGARTGAEETATMTVKSTGDVSIKGAIDNPTLPYVTVNDGLFVFNNAVLGGDVQVVKNITILGHLKAAAGIGSFSDVASDLVSIPAGTLRMAEIACPSGQVITGCGFYKSDATYLLAITAVVKGSNTCQAVGKNQSSTAYNIQARAFCFNPNGG